MDILVVSGMSGAGKTTALHALEDLGFHPVDNLPVSLLHELVGYMHQARPGVRLAVGVDARDPRQLDGFAGVREQLLAEGHRVDIFFIDAPDAVIVRRYAETRRRYPMGELPGSLTLERQILAPIRALATGVVDTERMTTRQLRALVRDRFGERERMAVTLMSFGFKIGIPLEADVVFDARFLANPYDVPDLRPRTGLEAVVQEFVLAQTDTAELLQMLEAWVRFHVPRAWREGRPSLTIAIGCTGGQHRSVTLVETLAKRLQPTLSSSDRTAESTSSDAMPGVQALSATVHLRHRDLGIDV